MFGIESGAFKGSRYLDSVLRNQALEPELRRAMSLREKDTVSIFTLPPALAKNKGSYTFKPNSLEAMRLQRMVNVTKGRISDIQNADISEDERRRKLRVHNCELNYLNCKLNKELASLPQHTMVIMEAQC